MATVTIVNGSVSGQHVGILSQCCRKAPHGLSIAAIVPDFSPLNIPQELLIGLPIMSSTSHSPDRAEPRDGDGEADPMPLRLSNGSVFYGLINKADAILALIKVLQYGKHDVVLLEAPSMVSLALFSYLPTRFATVTDDLLGFIDVRGCHVRMGHTHSHPTTSLSRRHSLTIHQSFQSQPSSTRSLLSSMSSRSPKTFGEQ